MSVLTHADVTVTLSPPRYRGGRDDGAHPHLPIQHQHVCYQQEAVGSVPHPLLRQPFHRRCDGARSGGA